MRPTSLSIVAPCYNEQEVLPEFLRRVRAAVEQLGMAIEIVLVDDGSRDATWPIIAEAAGDDRRILGYSPASQSWSSDGVIRWARGCARRARPADRCRLTGPARAASGDD